MMGKAANGRFGGMALELGYVRRRDVKKALSIQRLRESRGQAAPLLGEVLKELGCLTEEQCQEVFNRQLDGKKGGRASTWWRRLRGA